MSEHVPSVDISDPMIRLSWTNDGGEQSALLNVVEAYNALDVLTKQHADGEGFVAAWMEFLQSKGVAVGEGGAMLAQNAVMHAFHEEVVKKKLTGRLQSAFTMESTPLGSPPTS